MLCGCSIVIVKLSAKVITIEPVQNALSVEQVVKLFSTASEQICALKEVDKFVVEGGKCWGSSGFGCKPALFYRH
jgi:hypothetical protein